ncbi:MAG TPA: right-handed parallel beta-helix repeat-containing protein [Anaerolineales bacterium]|nr:right-handed parallel beta-helix repeat-containing protein [Anaerolineales bacterium]
MVKLFRASFLSLAIILSLLFSVASPIIAYADGDSPPTPTETPQPTETVVVTDESDEETPEVTATPQPTETVVVTDESAEESTEAVATPVPTEETSSEEQTDEASSNEEDATTSEDTSLLSDVPDDTTVIVLNEDGEAEPLATEAAADAIATSDPIWCPGNQPPTPDANGCTPSFNSFDALLTFLSGNAAYQGAGTIYVQQGAYLGNDPKKVIDFNSSAYDLSNINNSSLTLTGGWNPADNTINASNPNTFNDYSIIIGSSENPWGGSLTISNFVVTDSSKTGMELHTTESVNIKDSKFDHNRNHGALIRAGQNVNIANSSFSNAPTGRSQRVGLDIVSGGSTSLVGVIANWNRFTGVNINAGGDVSIANSDFSHTKHAELDGVSIYDTRVLTNSSDAVFSGYGLLVITNATVSIDDITANDNFLWGAALESGGDIAISNSVFSGNTTAVPGFIDDTGLIINSDGNVALSNVTADDNRLYGAVIDAAGMVTVNNSNFNNNRGVITVDGVTTLYGIGLKINSLSDIFINNTTATNNMLFGGQLSAAGLVNVANSNFSDTSTDAGQPALGTGLEIVSNGNASLFNVILNHNQTDGAMVASGGDIYLDDMIATNNGANGVSIEGSCTHLNGGEYTGNGQYGLNLGNSALNLVNPANMSGNGAGDIFPVSPPVCTAATGGTPPVSGSSPFVPGITPANSVNYPNLFVGYFNSETSGLADGATQNISLLTFLAENTLGAAAFDPSTDGPFTGRYIYIHSDNGLIYVVALLP